MGVDCSLLVQPGVEWPALAAGSHAGLNSPDPLLVILFIAIAFGVPLVGNLLMIADIRRYLRSFRRALVVITRVVTPGSPYWARRDSPPCLQAFGLQLPITEEQVLHAYRSQVKSLHPDKGGSLQAFLQLQRYYEQAMHLARSESSGKKKKK